MRQLFVGTALAAALPSSALAQSVTDVLGLSPVLNSLWPLLRWSDWAFVAAGLIAWRQRNAALLLACLLLRILPEAVPSFVNNVLGVPFSRQDIVNIGQIKQLLLSLSPWLLLAYAAIASLVGGAGTKPST